MRCERNRKLRQKITIIPASGIATRIGGLPKFLLPTIPGGHLSHAVESSSLLEMHIEYGLDFADLVVIATRPEHAHLVQPFVRPGQVEIVIIVSSTMSETICRVARMFPAEQSLVLMPDTYYSHGFEPSQMALDSAEVLSVAIWKVLPEQVGSVGQILCASSSKGMEVVAFEDKNPECKFPWLWGVMNLSLEAINLLSPSSPHVGYVLNSLKARLNEVGVREQEGEYCDCGTPAGFLRHLDLARSL